MINIDANIEDFTKQLLAAANDVEKINNSVCKEEVQKFWRKYRSLVVEYFRHMQTLHERIPTFDAGWAAFKGEARGVLDQLEIGKLLAKYGRAPFQQGGYNWLARYNKFDDYFYPVESADPWHTTGTMQRMLEAEWSDTQNDYIEEGDAVARISMAVDVSMLQNSYPIVVDEKLMDRSGQSIGVMRLFVWQQQQLFDALERDMTGFVEAVFARGAGG